MDFLKTKIKTIEEELHQSGRTLQTLESNAHDVIVAEVQEMRRAVVRGDRQIEHVQSETQRCLIILENEISGSADLKPQLAWLRTNVNLILEQFQNAESHADAAIEQTITYKTKINDIGQRVGISKAELRVAERNGEKLASSAQSRLQRSEQRVNEIQEKIDAKEGEIREKTSEASDLEDLLKNLEREIEAICTAAREAEKRAKKKKGMSIAGTGALILGLVLAPASGGTSLLLAGVGGGVGLDAAIKASDFKEQARELYNQANALHAEINHGQQVIATLQQEKDEYEELILQYELEVHRRQSNHSDYRAEIEKARRAQGDIMVLKERAQSTTANVKELQKELQKTKQQLDRFSAALNSNALEIRTWSSFLGLLLTRRRRKAREFQKQKKAIRELSSALESVHEKVPMLLPALETKFLEQELWNKAEVPYVSIGDHMPDISWVSEVEHHGGEAVLSVASC